LQINAKVDEMKNVKRMNEKGIEDIIKSGFEKFPFLHQLKFHVE
jgi:hypothetical protein